MVFAPVDIPSKLPQRRHMAQSLTHVAGLHLLQAPWLLLVVLSGVVKQFRVHRSRRHTIQPIQVEDLDGASEAGPARKKVPQIVHVFSNADQPVLALIRNDDLFPCGADESECDQVPMRVHTECDFLANFYGQRHEVGMVVGHAGA